MSPWTRCAYLQGYQSTTSWDTRGRAGDTHTHTRVSVLLPRTSSSPCLCAPNTQTPDQIKNRWRSYSGQEPVASPRAFERTPCAANSSGPRPALSVRCTCARMTHRHMQARPGPGERRFPTTAGLWWIYDSGSGIHKPPLSLGRMTMHSLQRGLCWSLWQTLSKLRTTRQGNSSSSAGPREEARAAAQRGDLNGNPC